LSLGGPSTDAAQIAYRAVVEYAAKKAVIVVAAAGNENDDAMKKVPASVKGIIAVAATDEQNRKASFSNDVSKIKWAIAAPGVNIFSTIPGSRYDYMSGTSMATPYVAGLLGLLKAIDPTIDAERAFNIVNESARETLSGKRTGRLIQPMSAVLQLIN
jgi:thermitase